MTFFLIAALAAAAAFARAAPTPRALVRRDCSSIPDPDPNVRNQIYSIGKQMGINDLTMEVMFVTALQESNINNLDCGDQDSLGVFQQRPSQGWGNPSQLMNVTYSTHAFLNVAIPVVQQNPNGDAGDLAQIVQVAQAGNQYTKQEGRAREQIALAEAAVGGGGGSPAPSSQAPAPSSQAPAPSSSGPGGAGNVGATPTTSMSTPSPSATTPPDNGGDDGDCSCAQEYTPVPGDDCIIVSQRYGISLQDFYNMNPEIDPDCQNLQIDQGYCVQAADS